AAWLAAFAHVPPIAFWHLQPLPSAAQLPLPRSLRSIPSLSGADAGSHVSQKGETLRLRSGQALGHPAFRVDSYLISVHAPRQRKFSFRSRSLSSFPLISDSALHVWSGVRSHS